MKKTRPHIGLVWTFDVLRNGEVIDTSTIHNLLPQEMVTYLMNAGLKGGTQVTTWYMAPYEGNYTPVSTDTAATFPAAATECTAYDEATRREWVEGSVVSGVLNNLASKAEFTFNAVKTIYGGFLTSNPTKGASTGVLGSVVRLPSPKTPGIGDVLRLSAGFSLTSL